MSQSDTEEMDRQRRQEDISQQKRESRYLTIIVGQALGLLIMLGFNWAILLELKDNQKEMMETVKSLVINQASFAPTIDRADRFIDDHNKEHLEYWKHPRGK